MKMPGFTAENATGRTGPFRTTRSAGAGAGLYPQGIPGGDYTVARCLPKFEWVWAVCNHIDGNPIYCRELEFLGWACS